MVAVNALRDEPFSDVYGYDRGGPIDRVFIESFLDKHRNLIRGRVLEVESDHYARRFGSDLTSVDVLDVYDTNPNATVIANLSEELPGQYDCVILTQVLQYMPEPVNALRNAYGALADGGALLAIVPAIQRVAPGDEGDDYWRFTLAGTRQLVRLAVDSEPTELEAFGGLASSVASLLGLGLWDHRPRNRGDARFATIVGFVLRKVDES